MEKKLFRHIITILVCWSFLSGCTKSQNALPTSETQNPLVTSIGISPTQTPELILPTQFISSYSFPDSIDSSKQYLFYLHGKIIEDQGIPAVSAEFGEYQYQAILEKLSSYGLIVISEQREKNTDSIGYARRISGQVRSLLQAGVSAKNITVVGASQGAWITVYVSHLLENKEVNFVLISICHPDVVETFERDEITLYGNVLSIYDFSDHMYAGTCKDLFSFSEVYGELSRHEELVLQVGIGHGIVYRPLDEWIVPTIQWAEK